MASKKPAKRKKSLLPLSRPATPQDIVDRARQYGPACIDALADEVANGSGMSRVCASNSLLDRGFGKVGQRVEVTGDGGGPLTINIVKFSESEDKPE
jgi:hypothetical protein